MLFSTSSAFITLIVAAILIFLFNRLLLSDKLIRYLRVDLLLLLAALIIIRLLLPVELPFTVTVAFPQVMNRFQAVLEYQLLPFFDVLMLLCMIELIGVVFQLFRYITNLIKCNEVADILNKMTEHKKVSDYFEIDPGYDFPVWIGSQIDSPFVLGSKKIIFLPDIVLSQREMKYVLQHEIQHIKNHDNLIKQILNVLKIIYWWFPPVYSFSNKVQLALEMRVDRQITKKYTVAGMVDYAETIVRLKEKILDREYVGSTTLPISSSFFIGDNERVLTFRINYLLNSSFKKKTNAVLLCVVLLLPFFSNAVVFEPYHTDDVDDGVYTEQEFINQSYLVDNHDGTYTLILDGESSTIENPQYYLDLGIQIKE